MKMTIRVPGRAISSNVRLQPIFDVKTKKARMVSRTSKSGRKKEIETILMLYAGQLRAIGKAFNPRVNYFHTTYRFIYPKKDFWTKKKTMNSKLLDADNGIKTVKDLVYSIIGVNDKMSRRESSEVSPGTGEYFEIIVELKRWEDDLPAEMMP